MRERVREQSIGRSFGLGFLLVAAMVCVVPASAFAATAHKYEKAFGPDCTEASDFEAPGAVAVDQQSHDVYVADIALGAVVRCAANGTPALFTAGPGAGTNQLPGFSFSSFEGLTEIAVNPATHDFYVTDTFGGSIKAFHANGEAAKFSALPGNEIPSAFGVGVAVDKDGAIYIGDFEAVHVFAPSGTELTTFAAGEAANVAVDSQGAVYVANSAEAPRVSKFIPSEFPVTATTTYTNAGIVDSTTSVAISVDPSNDDLYVDQHFPFPLQASQINQYDKEGKSLGSFAGPGRPGELTRSEGLAVDGTSGTVYASDIYESGIQRKVKVFVVPPLTPPVVESTTATEITSTSAELRAQINPELFATHFHFEYLSEAEFQANGETFAGAKSTGEVNLGSSEGSQTAHGHAGGLSPGTTYRFRVVATSEGGTATGAGPVASFTTFPALGPLLPDGRAYEQVSPAQKSGEVFAPNPEFGGSCRDCLPGINGAWIPMQSAPDGNSVLYQGTPFKAGLASGSNEYRANRGSDGWGTDSLSTPLMRLPGYRAFSTDLLRGVLLQTGAALSPQAPIKGGLAFANLYLRETDGSVRPLVIGPPPNRDPGSGTGASFFTPTYAGANSGAAGVPAFDHVIFAANDALTAAVPTAAPAAPDFGPSNCKREAQNCNLYEWTGGNLRLVNVRPGNVAVASGAAIGAGRLLSPTDFSREGSDVDNAISADGRRIFWTSEETGEVYVRVDGKETIVIPSPGTCKVEIEPLEARVCFLTASEDGSRVLLSNGQLYELDGAGAYQPATDLSQGQGGFEGILGASEDLASVYFVDTAVLEPGAEAGEPNLYVRSGGTTSFIVTLDRSDNDFFRYGDWRPAPSNRLAQVTPDGRYLAFMSSAPLTGYDNERSNGKNCGQGAEASKACPQVFHYDVVSSVLSCVSCNPSGQRPRGLSNLSLIFETEAPLPQPHNLTPDGQGRLFFESQDVLSPRDVNGAVQDVYEWEPNGVGDCRRPAGCIALISSGHSPNDSQFLDASANGDDAFIVTREQLLPRDKDQLLDVYDARVGGGIEVPQTAPCEGEGCKGPASEAPVQPSSGSSSFVGPGNQKPAKPKKKAHKKKKHHKKKHHKRAAKHRGGRGK